MKTLFNQTQNFYLKNKKKLYHTSNGEQTKTSLLCLDDISQKIDLIEKFWYNINVLIDNHILEIGYCGKKFFLNYKSDSNKNINFLDYPINKNTLKNIILKSGSYLPILMFFDEDECLTAIECVHTQHTLRVIQEMFQNEELNNELFLFIIKPNFLNKIKEKIEFILPFELYNKVGYLLNLDFQIIDESYIKLFSNNVIDLWLLFKLYHKEASYYIVNTMEFLHQNNIEPPSFLNKRS